MYTWTYNSDILLINSLLCKTITRNTSVVLFLLSKCIWSHNSFYTVLTNTTSMHISSCCWWVLRFYFSLWVCLQILTISYAMQIWLSESIFLFDQFPVVQWMDKQTFRKWTTLVVSPSFFFWNRWKTSSMSSLSICICLWASSGSPYAFPYWRKTIQMRIMFLPLQWSK